MLALLVAERMALRKVVLLARTSTAAVVKVLPAKLKASVNVPCTPAGKPSMVCTAPVATVLALAALPCGVRVQTMASDPLLVTESAPRPFASAAELSLMT